MSYKDARSAYLNCEKRIYDGVGMYGFPEIQPCKIQLDSAPEAIGFNFAIGDKHPQDKIVHFYLDDYQFMRVWNDVDRYVPILKRFKAVLQPDFSLYSDFSRAAQIFNHYRKQWLGRYWQEAGIDVIPTICWSDETSFEWCFDGVPQNSIVSISTVGGFRSKESKANWLKGYHECIKRLQPSKILLFGAKYAEVDLDTNQPVEIVVAENSVITKFNKMKVKVIE